MRIKEVEEQTGLTAKAIRLYESKGLLAVSRQSQNDYRDYTQEDVTRLKTIALLRKLDIPVKTIKTWTDGQASLEEILRGAAERSQTESQENELKHRIAADLAEIAHLEPQADLPQCADDIKEIHTLLGELEEATRRQNASLLLPALMTVISFGPIVSAILGILEEQKERALLAFALSVVSIALAALSWSNYFKTPRRERDRGGCLLMLLAAVVVLVLMFTLMVGLEILQERLFVPETDMIRLFREPWSKLVFLFEIELIGAGFAVIDKPWKGRTFRPAMVAAAVIGIFAVNGMLLYGCLTGVSVADETGITKYGFFAPAGEKVAYTDIEMVECGFTGKKMGLVTGDTGTFYYKLHYADGTVEDWGESNCSSEEQTWAWMLRLDGWLMEAGVPKRASAEYGEYCDLDSEYVEIFYQVISSQQE